MNEIFDTQSTEYEYTYRERQREEYDGQKPNGVVSSALLELTMKRRRIIVRICASTTSQ